MKAVHIVQTNIQGEYHVWILLLAPNNIRVW